MPTFSVRVSDDEAERIVAKADAMGLNRSDILRAALTTFMEPDEGRRSLGSFLRRDKQADVPGEGRISPKDCDHPLSVRLQTGHGVLCDRCGTYV